MATEKEPIAIELLVEETGLEVDMFAPDTFEGFLQELRYIFPSVASQDIPLYYQFWYMNRNEVLKSFCSDSSYAFALRSGP
jgi:hypothetical protein